jgi:hypothetical protein
LSDTQARSVSPWRSIWLRPRETIRRIVDSDPSKRVLLLAVLEGIGQSLDRASLRNVGDRLSLPGVLLLCTIVGTIFGPALLYLGGALVRWTGSWLGGQASAAHVRAAIAWGLVPDVWALLLWIPELLLFREELFTSRTPRIDDEPLLALALLGSAAVQIVAVLWSAVTVLKCVGEVHRFSAWKALLAAILALFALVVPIVALALFYRYVVL